MGCALGSSNAISGVGTIFHRWDDVSAWVALAEINSISGPTMTRETIDVTSLSSTGGFKEAIAGFRDGGTVSLTMNFTQATYAIIYADFEDDAPHYYEIVLPDATNSSFEFCGLVTECPLDIPTDDKVTVNVTIKISGRVAFNSGGSAAPSS
jgi:predicted secreted protein